MHLPLYLRSASPRRIGRYLRRIRHRCGYGIHSPFAFSFVTGVVYEKGEYYAYPALRGRYRTHGAGGLRLKDALLLFRLANFAHPARTLLLLSPAEQEWRAYIEAAVPTTTFTPAGHACGLIVAGSDWPRHAQRLAGLLEEGGMLVVRHTARHAATRRAWRTLTQSPRATVSFDLADLGIVFYLPRMQRAAYVVNYF